MKKSPYPTFTKHNKRLEKLMAIPEPMRTYDEVQELHLLAEICRLMIQYRWPYSNIDNFDDSKVL